MVKKLNWKFDFWFILLLSVLDCFGTLSSKKGSDRKGSVKSQSGIIFFKFRYLKTEIIVRNQDSGGWHLHNQQFVQAIPCRQSKESIESHLVKDCIDWSVIKKNRSCNNYQCLFTLFTSFKKSTQDSHEYNFAAWAVKLSDVLDLKGTPNSYFCVNPKNHRLLFVSWKY